MFAKVKGTEVFVYPYRDIDLYEENPHSSFDDRFTLPEWFAQTNAAVVDGYELVEVQQLPNPAIDYSLNHAIAAAPKIIDGAWVCGWNIVPKTEAELQEIANLPLMQGS